nr:hypothetical protein [Stutzerimonas stutzeri]
MRAACVQLSTLQLKVSYVTKDELRAELERQAQRFTNIYGGEVTTYAAEREPERKPWRKKPSLVDQVFQQELQKLEQDKRSDLDSPA